jgi:hypothetical protein
MVLEKKVGGAGAGAEEGMEILRRRWIRGESYVGGVVPEQQPNCAKRREMAKRFPALGVGLNWIPLSA